MATNLSSLGYSYGANITGSALAAILNNATDQIAITGTVKCTSDLTFNGPNIDIIGNGVLDCNYNSITILNMKSIDGLSKILSNNFTFKASIPGFKIANIGQIQSTLAVGRYDDPVYDMTGAVFQNIGSCAGINGKSNGARFINVNSGQITYGGANNIFDGGSASSGGAWTFKFYPGVVDCRTSQHNIVQNYTISGGKEEIVGWDTYNTSPWPCTVTEIAAEYLVLSPITRPVAGSLPSGFNWISGTSALDRSAYVLVLNGTGAGRYFPVVGQQDAKVYIDTSKFSLAGVNVGDLVNLGNAFVENVWQDNIIHNNCPVVENPRDGYGNRCAISIWGDCYGNKVLRNKIYQYYPDSSAFNDGAYCDLGGWGPVTNYHINSNNEYRDNKIFWVNGMVTGTQDIRWDWQNESPPDGEFTSTVAPQPDYASDYDDPEGYFFVRKNRGPFSLEMGAWVEVVEPATGLSQTYLCRKAVQTDPLTHGTIYTGNQSYLGSDESNPVQGVAWFKNQINTTFYNNGSPSDVSYRKGLGVQEWFYESLDFRLDYDGTPSLTTFAAYTPPEVKRVKLRSPSGGKIRGKGAGKVSGKPQ